MQSFKVLCHIKWAPS